LIKNCDNKLTQLSFIKDALVTESPNIQIFLFINLII